MVPVPSWNRDSVVVETVDDGHDLCDGTMPGRKVIRSEERRCSVAVAWIRYWSDCRVVGQEVRVCTVGQTNAFLMRVT